MNATQFWQWGANGRPTFNFDESEVNQGNIEEDLSIYSFYVLNYIDPSFVVVTNPGKMVIANTEVYLVNEIEDYDKVNKYAHFIIEPDSYRLGLDKKMIVSDLYDKNKIIYHGSLPYNDFNIGFISQNCPFLLGNKFESGVDQTVFHRTFFLFNKMYVNLKIYDPSNNKLYYNLNVYVSFEITYK